MTSGSRLSGLIAIALTLAACGSAGATSSPSAAAPTPTPVPGASSGSGGNTGGGIPPPGGGVGVDPILGQATFVVPQAGQQDVRPVNVQLIRAGVDGRHLTVELRWWSGVAPCTVLDSVEIGREGSTFTLTAHEGSSGQPVACIDIAQLKATVVNLGDLDPGTYTIAATGDAKPVTVTIS